MLRLRPSCHNEAVSFLFSQLGAGAVFFTTSAGSRATPATRPSKVCLCVRCKRGGRREDQTDCEARLQSAGLVCMCVILRVQHQLGPLLPDRLDSPAHWGSSLLSLCVSFDPPPHPSFSFSLLFPLLLVWGPVLVSPSHRRKSTSRASRDLHLR